jgi:hypothetical protein
MSVYSLDDIKKLSKLPTMCPRCVGGPIVSGWNRKYIAKRVWLRVNMMKELKLFPAVLQLVIECKIHGEVIKEVEL